MSNNRIVKVKRLIPNGANNPNTGKPYFNMETKLKEMFDYFDQAFCEVPISIRNERDITFPQIRAEDVVGFVKEFSDTDMTIKVFNEELFGIYKDPRVEICALANHKMLEDETYIDRVMKLVLIENPEVK